MAAKKDDTPLPGPAREGERRRHARLCAEFDVQLDILISEDQVQPVPTPARCVDISPWGMRVSISSLTRQTYRKLIARNRDIRVQFRLSDLHETFVLTGRGVWFDYHNDSEANDSGPCKIGISFWNEGAERLEAYGKLFEKLSDGDSP